MDLFLQNFLRKWMLQKNQKNKLSKRKTYIYEIVDLTLDNNNEKS